MKVLLAGRLRYQNEDHDDHHHDNNHISYDNHHHFYDDYHRFYDNLNDNNWVTTWKTKSCLMFKTVLMRLWRSIMLHGQH